jgi:hypothetical protein
MKLIDAMTSTKLADFAFRNHGDWSFSNDAKAWGLDTPSFSSGAAYGDLDGDGAPDLVVNNVNDPAFIFRNNARTLDKDNHYLQVRLDGEGNEPLRRRRTRDALRRERAVRSRSSTRRAASSRAWITC